MRTPAHYGSNQLSLHRNYYPPRDSLSFCILFSALACISSTCARWRTSLRAYPTTHLQVELRRERPVLHITDVILGEVQVGEVAETTERRVVDRPNLVLVQPEIHNGAVEKR